MVIEIGSHQEYSKRTVYTGNLSMSEAIPYYDTFIAYVIIHKISKL